MILTPSGSPVLAQSAASFATRPYLVSAQSAPTSQVKADPQVEVTPQTKPKPSGRPLADAASGTYQGPLPIVMFRAATPRAKAIPFKPLEKQHLEIRDNEPSRPEGGHVPALSTSTAQPVTLVETDKPIVPLAIKSRRSDLNVSEVVRDRASLDTINPALESSSNLELNRDSQALAASGPKQQPNQAPLRRILRDTGKSLIRDLPEALADALPWVDKPAKGEPFEAVLDRVSDELQRANNSDPAWALPAQREIRALSKRLETLSAPPPDLEVTLKSSTFSMVDGVDERPFRPRPIWPGASGRPEAQTRPVTVLTTTGQQTGPRVSGIASAYTPAPDDDDGNPAQKSMSRVGSGPASAPPPRRSGRSK